MQPVSPVIPGTDIDEVVYAADQPQYRPLPAFKCLDGKILTRWQMSEAEKKLICEQGYIYLAVSTFNEPLQPVMLAATPPDNIETVDWEEARQSALERGETNPLAMVASSVPQPTPEDQGRTEARG
ncbi:MAG TPA: hypothetical protein VIX17_11465 [Pyrinomonadaceae bacterium]|jgi:hypothetical protein